LTPNFLDSAPAASTSLLKPGRFSVDETVRAMPQGSGWLWAESSGSVCRSGKSPAKTSAE